MRELFHGKTIGNLNIPALLEYRVKTKRIKLGFNANSLAQTFALIFEGADLEGASNHSRRRTFLTHLVNQGNAFTCSRR